jgi:hypothetical protein
MIERIRMQNHVDAMLAIWCSTILIISVEKHNLARYHLSLSRASYFDVERKGKSDNLKLEGISHVLER